MVSPVAQFMVSPVAQVVKVAEIWPTDHTEPNL